MKQRESKEREHYSIEPERTNLALPLHGDYVSKTELCKAINRSLHNSFSDYRGSNIRVSNGIPYIELVFEEPDQRSINHALPCDGRAFKPITMNAHETNDRVKRFIEYQTMINRKRYYEMTEYGSDILSQFMYPQSSDPYYIDSKKYVVEDIKKIPYGGVVKNLVLCTVTGIDPNKLLHYVYSNEEGAKFKDDEIISLTLVRFLNGFAGPGSRINEALYRLDIVNVDIFEEYGIKYQIGVNPNMNSGNLDIITDF